MSKSTHPLRCFETALAPAIVPAELYSRIERAHVTDDCPVWVASAVASLAAALWGASDPEEIKNDITAGMDFVATLSPVASTDYHSGGGHMHCLAILERDGERVLLWSADCVGAHRTTETDPVEAFHETANSESPPHSLAEIE